MTEMKVWAVILAAGLSLGMHTVCPAATFDDGQVHTIDYATVSVNIFDGPNLPPDVTTVNLVDGGEVSDVEVHEHSEFRMFGGTIEEDIEVYDDARVVISGGSVDEELQTFGNARVTVSGGNLGGEIEADGHSEITITGGTLEFHMSASGDSRIFILGTDFSIDGSPVDYGPIPAVPIGELTGILQNGDPLFTMFMIGDNGSIILLPEPATVVLLVVSGFVIAGRRITSVSNGRLRRR
jgi:hypothetical protein